jgi:2-oxoglutarate dehydrogenase E1 component
VYEADEFANFCANKFNTAKRFGIEGVQAFIPGMKILIDTLASQGGEKVIVGMPHRGRLNFLANVIRKPLETIFAEFQGYTPEQ